MANTDILTVSLNAKRQTALNVERQTLARASRIPQSKWILDQF
jgi:hypothetical protein